MAKFVIKCPTCASDAEHPQDVYLTVSSGLFAKKKVTCPNGHTVDIKANRMAVRVCPHCGNNVVYDQKKGDSAECPVCKTKLNTLENNVSFKQLNCPQCGCEHTVAKNAASMECAVCGCIIDVQKELGKKAMREKNVVSLIKYEGDNSFFVWKHPIEDFQFGSQLIVHESQEALFFANGQALDLFGAGTYTLTTENIPLLNKVYKVPSGTETFHSEVYYINKTVHTGIKWGTDSKIGLFDPVSGMHIKIGASGQLNMAVTNSKRLIMKLVGTTEILSHQHDMNNVEGNSQYIFQYIKTLIVTKVKTHLANVIREKGWSILEIDSYLEVLANEIKAKINPELGEYGLTISEFFILHVSTPEDSDNANEKNDYLRMKRQYGEKYLRVQEEEIKKEEALAAQSRKLVEAQTEAQIELIKAQGQAESERVKGLAEAEVQRAQGFTGKDKLQFDVQKTFAENIGNLGGEGGNLGDLIGLGVGMGVFSKVGNTVRDMMVDSKENMSDREVGTSRYWTCRCGAAGQTGNFCNTCGKPRIKTWTCGCGAVGQTGNFCSVCGKAKPEEMQPWVCSCGAAGQTGNFCSVCGKSKDQFRGEEKSDERG